MAFAVKKENGLYYYKAYDLSRWTLATHFFDLSNFYQHLETQYFSEAWTDYDTNKDHADTTNGFKEGTMVYEVTCPAGHPLLKTSSDGDAEFISQFIDVFSPEKYKITNPTSPVGGNTLEFIVQGQRVPDFEVKNIIVSYKGLHYK
jgi:hypothetical protein